MCGVCVVCVCVVCVCVVCVCGVCVCDVDGELSSVSSCCLLEEFTLLMCSISQRFMWSSYSSNLSALMLWREFSRYSVTSSPDSLAMSTIDLSSHGDSKSRPELSWRLLSLDLGSHAGEPGDSKSRLELPCRRAWRL